jgi:hypothetical protein
LFSWIIGDGKSNSCLTSPPRCFESEETMLEELEFAERTEFSEWKLELLTIKEVKKLLVEREVEMATGTLRDFVWINNYFRQNPVVVDLSNGSKTVINGVNDIGELICHRRMKSWWIEEEWELKDDEVFTKFTSWLTDEVVTVLKRFLKQVQS